MSRRVSGRPLPWWERAREHSQPPGRSAEPMSVPRTFRAPTVAVEDISRAILVLRGHKVLLDAELAALYGVTTKRLNEQVKRNAERFPEDFIDISARKPLTSVRGAIALQSCPSRVSLSTHGGTAEYRGIVGASRPVVEVRHRTLTRSARSNNRCSPTRK